MKKLLIGMALTVTSMSWAQIYTPTASELTMSEAEKLFQVFEGENAKMEEHSECFERAHMWSMRADRVHRIKTEKAFLFFTRKFDMAHNVTTWYGKSFRWWFHVDATFSDKIQTMQEWAQSLMKDPEVCQELINYEDYVTDRNTNNEFQCYYMSTPQYVYGPIDMGLKDAGQIVYTPGRAFSNKWEEHHAKWSLKAYSKKYRNDVKRDLRFK
jgi:hypothetical protein